MVRIGFWLGSGSRVELILGIGLVLAVGVALSLVLLLKLWLSLWFGFRLGHD